jgi:hypothetical protein
MAEIHITIRYDGAGLPSLAELAARRQLEDALEDEEVGDVVDAGGGMGVMDIYLDVDDVPAALARAKAIVARLGLADRTIVEEALKAD